MSFRISSVAAGLAREVRETLVSPQYGHPAHRDVARGYGPCRSCLRTFERDRDVRLLFTYNPFETGVPAPGPVFIHAEACTPHADDVFPADVRSLPLLFEPLSASGVPIDRRRVDGATIESTIESILADGAVASILVRNAEAGCFIARIERRS